MDHRSVRLTLVPEPVEIGSEEPFIPSGPYWTEADATFGCGTPAWRTGPGYELKLRRLQEAIIRGTVELGSFDLQVLGAIAHCDAAVVEVIASIIERASQP